jgi:PRTRC genetic system protein C
MAENTLRPVLKMGAMKLAFPDPGMEPDEVRELYAANYPILAHSRLGEPYTEGDDLIYEVAKPEAKDKG